MKRRTQTLAACAAVLAATAAATTATEAEAAPAQNPKLVAIAPNTAIDLGHYSCQNPAGASGGCEAITDFSGMVYDYHRHQLLMFGGGHAGTSGTLRSDVSVFDFTTLTWTSAYAPTSCADMNAANIDTANGAWLSTNQPLSRHTYDMLVMLDDPPQMLMTTSGAVGPEVCSGGPAPAGLAIDTKIAGYDPDSKKWAFRSTSPGQWDSFSSAEYDPISKTTIILGSHGLWSYDAKTDAFAGSQFVPDELGYANNMVYAPETDRMYYFWRGSPTRVFELALDRAAWKASTLTELVGAQGPATPETGFAHDSVNHLIGGAVVDGTFSAFDPKAKSWTTVVMKTDPPGGTIGTMAFHEIAFDPVDGVYVFVTNGASGFHVWAYRHMGAPPAPPPPGSSPMSSGDAGADGSGAPGSSGSDSSDPGATPARADADAASGCDVTRGASSASDAASVGIAGVMMLLGAARRRKRARA